MDNNVDDNISLENQYSYNDLINLKNNIQELDIDGQIEITKILVKDDVVYSISKNGLLFNISNIKQETIDKIDKFVKYKFDNDKLLKEQDNERNDFINKLSGSVSKNE